MTRFKEGDLVTTRKLVRFLGGDGLPLLEVPAGVHGIVKHAGQKLSVKFVGYRQCTVAESEVIPANTLDRLAWDFGEIDEHSVIETSEQNDQDP